MHLSKIASSCSGRHGDRVLVAVAVHPDLVPGRGHGAHLLGKVSIEWPGTNQVGLDARSARTA
jgi:hypothetical protein